MNQHDLCGLSTHRLEHNKNHQTEFHAHLEGQLYFLHSGMMTCDSKNRRWSMTPNGIGWIPAQLEHSAVSWGNISGWLLYLPKTLGEFLPSEPTVFQSNLLIATLVERIAEYSDPTKLTIEQKRVIQVLLDEIKQAKQLSTLLLPFPQDPRLLKITQALLNDFTNPRSQAEWAQWAGISVRSLSRRFMQETGMVFSHWRQLAKVLASLEHLAQGERINNIAYALGFSDASAYIASFKSILGISPKNYLNRGITNIIIHQ